MKTNIFLTLIALFISSFAFSQRHQQGVVLFGDRDFGGQSFVLEEDWTQSCGAPLSIESIHVPRGWEVWAYSGASYTGDHMVLTSDWDGYSADASYWCNNINSVQIVRRPRTCGTPEPQTVRIFEHSNFEGESTPIRSDWSVDNWDDFWNDKISSISIPPGVEVVIYEHSHFQGESAILTGNWSVENWNDYWNDRISSIEVRYAHEIGYRH